MILSQIVTNLYEREVATGQEDKACEICGEVKHFEDFSKKELKVCKPCVKWVGLSPKELREEYFRMLKHYPSIYSTTIDISKDGNWDVLVTHRHLFIAFGALAQEQIDLKKNMGIECYDFKVFHSPNKAIEATIRSMYEIMELVSTPTIGGRLISSLKSLDVFVEEVSRIEFTMKDLDKTLDRFVLYPEDSRYDRELTDEEKTSIRNKLEKYAKD